MNEQKKLFTFRFYLFIFIGFLTYAGLVPIFLKWHLPNWNSSVISHYLYLNALVLSRIFLLLLFVLGVTYSIFVTKVRQFSTLIVLGFMALLACADVGPYFLTGSSHFLTARELYESYQQAPGLSASTLLTNQDYQALTLAKDFAEQGLEVTSTHFHKLAYLDKPQQGFPSGAKVLDYPHLMFKRQVRGRTFWVFSTPAKINKTKQLALLMSSTDVSPKPRIDALVWNGTT